MITWFIIGITVVISYMAFQNLDLMSKLQFNAAQIIHRKEYYRLVSHAFIHANWAHLGVNMLVLYFFGRNIESYFVDICHLIKSIPSLTKSLSGYIMITLLRSNKPI